jgi:hypothetical protein
VEENVAIGVAAEALVMRESYAADFQGDAGFEFVGIPAVADANFGLQDCFSPSLFK